MKLDCKQLDMMLDNTYGKIGGCPAAKCLLQEADTIRIERDPANRSHYLWFVASKDTAHGTKIIYSGTDGQRSSKLGLRGYLIELARKPGHYAEVSGPLFYLLERAGIPKIPASKVKKILDKRVVIVGEFEYERQIDGTVRRKVMFGFPNETQQQPTGGSDVRSGSQAA